MKWQSKAGLILLAAATVAPPAFAQNLNKERGNILAVDWNSMQVRLKDPQGRERTWPVSRNAVVEFNDKTSSFPNPKLQDLVAPMYVHFTFNAETKEIVKFEVAEVGFEPGGKPEKPADPAGVQTAVITAVDANVGQIEVRDRGRTSDLLGRAQDPAPELQGRRPREAPDQEAGRQGSRHCDEPYSVEQQAG